VLTGTEVLRWVRRFPLWCADRDYVFSRRSFVDGNDLYTVSEHASHAEYPADTEGKVRRVHPFKSCWRIRSVPSRNGKPNGATEVVLLHYEEMKLQQDVARLAVRRGMWPMIRKMTSVGLSAFARSAGATAARGNPGYVFKQDELSSERGKSPRSSSSTGGGGGGSGGRGAGFGEGGDAGATASDVRPLIPGRWSMDSLTSICDDDRSPAEADTEAGGSPRPSSPLGAAGGEPGASAYGSGGGSGEKAGTIRRHLLIGAAAGALGVLAAQALVSTALPRRAHAPHRAGERRRHRRTQNQTSETES